MSFGAGFSWQVHAASLKAMQVLLQKLQAASSEVLPQQQAGCIAKLLPGTPVLFEIITRVWFLTMVWRSASGQTHAPCGRRLMES